MWEGPLCPEENTVGTQRSLPLWKQLQRPKTDSGVIVKLDLAAADPANNPPAVLARDLAQSVLGKRAHNTQLRWMRHEILRFDREHLADLRDHGGQLIGH